MDNQAIMKERFKELSELLINRFDVRTDKCKTYPAYNVNVNGASIFGGWEKNVATWMRVREIKDGKFGFFIRIKCKNIERNNQSIMNAVDKFNYQNDKVITLFPPSYEKNINHIHLNLYNDRLIEFNFGDEIFINFLAETYKLYLEYKGLNKQLQKEKAYQSIDQFPTDHINATEREQIVKVRVQQHKFKSNLYEIYDSRCHMCGITNQNLLIASHIKPWSESNTVERTDRYNGFLLCPTHDKLFDQHLITFTDEGKIIISDNLSQYDKLNIRPTDTIKIYDRTKEYLKIHRQRFNEKNNKK